MTNSPKRILAIIAVVLSALIAGAQTVPPHNSLSATITDPIGHPFSRAFYQVQLIDSAGRAIPGTTAATYQGQPVSPTRYTGSLDTTGHFAISVVPTNVLLPATTKWQVSISAPNAGDMTINKAQAWNMIYATAITADTDLSAQLSAMAQPVNYIDANGPTAFPGVVYGADPTAAGQLATKNYVDAHSGSGTVSGLTNGKLPIATGPTVIGASSPLDYGLTTAAVVTSSAPIAAPSAAISGNVAADTSISSSSPAADIRAQGAVIDGVTDISASVTAAAARACTTSGVVLLPCTGSGCYHSGGVLPVCAGKEVVYKVQGTLSLGSTLIQGDGSPIICDGGTVPLSTGPAGPNCAISAPPAHGLLGTSTTAGTSSTFTPTFSGGSIANLPVGSAISVIDPITCTLTGSIVRTSDTFVTAHYTPPCRILPGMMNTIAGVTDSTFNGTATVISNDYQNGVITWRQLGQSPATSSGGTITSQDDESFESCTITAVSGSDLTCYFAHAHSATAFWGEVGVQTLKNSNSVHHLKGVYVRNAYGAGIRLNRSSYGVLDGVSALSVNWPSSIPIEADSSYGWRISNSVMQTANFPFCISTCTQQGYPFGLRITSISDPTVTDASDLNWIIDQNSWIVGGIKVDTNGNSTPGSLNKLGDIRLQNITIEQEVQSAVVVDPRFAAATNRGFSFYDVQEQDNFVGYGPLCLLSYTDPSTSGSVTFNSAKASGLNCLVNKNYGGQLVVNGVDYTQGGFPLPRYGGNIGVLNDGRMIEGEIRGEGAGMSPSLIPSATSPVTTDPSQWACVGTGCAVNLVAGPDGVANSAGEFVAGSATNPRIAVSARVGGTVTNDVILAGVWCRAGQNEAINTNCAGISGIGSPYLITTSGTDVFDNISINSTPSAYQQKWNSDWWHPIVSMTTVTTGSATSHTITMYLYGPSTTGSSVLYWQPFFIYVPYANKPSTWTDEQWFKELARWRTQLMHGYVPSNAPGGVLAINPSHKLYWGNDTDLYRGVQNATVTQIGITSNVLTVTALNTYYNGQSVTFAGIGTNAFLNGQTVTITTATSAGFTAPFTHANVTLATDTGTVSAAVLVTDQAFNASQYQVGGVPLKMGNLADVTNTGAISNYLLTCTSVTAGICTNATWASGPVSGQTANCLPKASSASALTGPSAVCDNGTTVTSTEAIAAPVVTVTGTPTNPTDAATVSYVAGHGGVSPGLGLIKTAAAVSNATLGYSAAPRVGYQMPSLNGFYYPTLTTANLTTSSGLSNVTVTYVDTGGVTLGTATGVGASVAGVAGTGSIQLPQPIDITQPGRFDVHICIGSNTTTPDTNILKVGFTSSGGSASNGIFMNGASQTDLTIFFTGTPILNHFGNTGGIASYTCGAVFVDWIGTGAGGLDASGNEYVWGGWIPDNPTLFTYGTGTPAFNAAYVNSPVANEQTFTSVKAAVINTFYISDASVNSIVTGVYVSQGRLDGPTDGLMATPGYISPIVLDDASTGRTYPSEVWIPPTYGTPQGNPLVNVFHQNGFKFTSTLPAPNPIGGGQPANVYANLFNTGYIIAGLTGASGTGFNVTITGCASGSASPYCTATATDWGSPTGNKYRNAMVGLVRQLLPNTNQMFRYCVSMGCLDALDDEIQHPGGAGIAMFSPALNLTAAYTLSGAAPFGTFSNFAANINNGFGTWYQSLTAANTGNTPASSPTAWQQIGNTTTGLPLGYMQPVKFLNRGAYLNTTAYNQNDIIESPFTGAVSALAAFDPNLQYNAFTTIPVQSWTEAQDSIVPTAWSSSFITGITSAGNSNATNNQLSDCTASGANTCHLSTGVFNPTLTATPWNTTTNPSPALTFFNTYRTPFPATVGSAQSVQATGGTGQPHNYATATKTANATSATAAAPCTATKCRVTLVGGTATTGTIFTMAWPAGTFNEIPLCTAVESGGTSMHNVSSGTETLTGTTISAGVTVSGATVVVDVTCLQP